MYLICNRNRTVYFEDEISFNLCQIKMVMITIIDIPKLNSEDIILYRIKYRKLKRQEMAI